MVERSQAQDLDPRAYARIPVNVTVVVAGFGYSQGGIVTDATLPLEDLQAKIGSPSLAVVHSFSLIGRTAQVSAALPYALGDASTTISGTPQSTSRSGFSDMRLRFSWLLLGAPAATLGEIAKAPRKTILGASLSITAPTGQYYPEKLINIGTSRWAFKQNWRFPSLWEKDGSSISKQVSGCSQKMTLSIPGVQFVARIPWALFRDI